MEGHFDPFLYGDYMGLDCLEEDGRQHHHHITGIDTGFLDCNADSSSVINTTNRGCHQMPFFHMLQEKTALLLELESPHPQPTQQQQPQTNSFQLLLKLQEEKLLLNRQPPPPPQHAKLSCLEIDSYVTADVAGVVEKDKDKEKVEGEEKKKRKRCRSSSTAKKAEEAESQRMSHIAVERNRRRVMNDHLAALRSLMPPSYIQRGDQASIVGGAIDFVKQLEQRLQSLQAKKQSRAVQSRSNGGSSNNHCPFDGFFTSPQYVMHKPSCFSSSSSSTSEETDGPGDGDCVGSFAESAADIEVMLIQTHVNMRIFAPKRGGQLVRAIAAMEELHLTVLHLNITSIHDSVLYSLNLKVNKRNQISDP